MKWFNNPQTLEDLKKQYKALALGHHPDCGGCVKDMQAINNAYDKLFQLLKNTHTNANGETYQSTNKTEETPEQFRDIINALINLQNITIEIIGNWIWVTGDTFSCKNILKQHKFKWGSKKHAWYFHSEPYKKKSKKALSLEDIRAVYGSQTVNTRQQELLAY